MPDESNTWEFLLDENLPKSLWKALRAAGYPAARVIDEGLRGQHDSRIFRQVRSRSIIITRDKDYLKTTLFPPPHSGIIVVNDPTAKAEGLCLCSTAILHTVAGLQLWLHRTTHQGVSTKHPCSSNLVGQAAFSVLYSEHL